jgi:Ca-activated chloride channel family protein
MTAAMQWVHPQILWLLLLLPPLAAWWRWVRRRKALPHPDLGTARRLPHGWSRVVAALRLGWRLAVVGLLIVALARPRWPDEETRVPAQSRAVLVALDVSGSMAQNDFLAGGRTVSRLAAARQVLGELLADRADDQVGLVTFAARVESVCPPTLSHSAVRRLLDEARPLGTPPDSSTNIGDALAEGIGLLRRARPERKVLILLSDGEHNVPEDEVPGALKPRQAARLAQALGVPVYTVFLGPPGGGPVNGTNGANGGYGSAREPAEALRDVASMTGGRFFPAGDAAALAAALRDIDRLEKTRVESFQYYRYHEAYPLVGLACIVLMVGGFALESSRWRPVP